MAAQSVMPRLAHREKQKRFRLGIGLLPDSEPFVLKLTWSGRTVRPPMITEITFLMQEHRAIPRIIGQGDRNGFALLELLLVILILGIMSSVAVSAMGGFDTGPTGPKSSSTTLAGG